MRKSMTWSVLFTVATMLAAAAPSMARADDIDKGTQDSLHAIITQQIDAFGRDDGDTAESFAAPGIKTLFPDPKGFVEMVHRSYAPLIHPRSTHFDAADTTSGGLSQKVTVVDSQGSVWTALYSFENIDGQWRINGCILVQEQSTTI